MRAPDKGGLLLLSGHVPVLLRIFSIPLGTLLPESLLFATGVPTPVRRVESWGCNRP